MKKGLILVVLMASMLFLSMLSPSATYQELRGNGSNGSYYYDGYTNMDVYMLAGGSR